MPIPLHRKASGNRSELTAGPVVNFESPGGNMHLSPFAVPLGAFLMVVIIVAITSMSKMREKELSAHQQLRTQEMEHERKLKELDIERAKIELEKARTTKNG
jgi:hypothetical protein